MIYNGKIEGKFVSLQSADVDDAVFTLKIRQDPVFNRFLPRINNTLDQQIAWIKSQREKEGDYFFVVRNRKNERIGTISLYDICGKHAEAGRLAMCGNAFENIEAQLLVFDFAFNQLDIDSVDSYIYAENTRAIKFSKQFGCVICGEIEKNGTKMCKAVNEKKAYEISAEKLKGMIYRSGTKVKANG